jgi:hypothetical protein
MYLIAAGFYILFWSLLSPMIAAGNEFWFPLLQMHCDCEI